jgi:sugar phosphate isomerase/epimerase
MNKILIQPTIDTLRDYEDYAGKTGYDFEVIDFAFPNILDSEYISVVKRYKAESRFPEKIIGMHGAFLDLYINSPDPAIKKVAQERIVRNLEIAKDLNIQYVAFHTNFLPMIEKESYYRNWVNAHVDFWKEIVEKFKITVLLENMWDKKPDGIAEVIEKVNSPYLKVLFDTGHANVFSKVPIKNWFEKLGKNIVYIQLNDNMGDGDSELPAGKGSVDWKEFDSLVKQHCDTPLVCLEVKDLNWVKETVEYLKKNSIYPFS